MKVQTLGHTGLQVSAIGFGCGPTAALMVSGTAKEQREAIACALDLGINYFDTAPGYGASQSETNLGEALRVLGARPVIATKVALVLEELTEIGSRIEQSVEASLRRLRTDSVDLIQLHNRIGARRASKAEFGTGALLTVEDVLGPGGVVAAFLGLRQRGLARYFGCSAFGGEMPVLQRVIDSGSFDMLSVHYSLYNDTALSDSVRADVRNYSAIGSRAAGRGMGIVALRILEGGALAPEAGEARATSLQRASARFGMGLTEAAIRFALSEARIGIALIGLSSVEQVRHACDCCDRGALPSETLVELRAKARLGAQSQESR